LVQIPIQRINPRGLPEADGRAAAEEIVLILLPQWASTGKAMPLAQTLLDSGCA
jgi:hypothetical protein